MTTRRRLVVPGAILAGVVSVMLCVLAMLPARPGVMKEKFDRVKEGMTRAEVGGILGGHDADLDMSDGDVLGRATLVWVNDDGSNVSIRFEDGKVADKHLNPSTETFTDKVRRWLGMENSRRTTLTRQL